MKKKLIIKFILFICIFWIFQYVVGLLLRDDYTTLTRTVIHYMHKAEVIETVILGDSHTYYAINPDLLTNETNVETYLCGSAAQDLDGTYALLRETHKFHPELKNVYIDIDYYIFNHSSIKSRSVLTSIWIISNYLKDIKIKMDYLFHAVPPKYYPDIFLKIGKDKFQINPKANLEATIARINGDYRNFRFSEDSKLASFSKGYLPKINESDDDNDVFINEKSLKPFSINQINSDWYNYMEKIIDYCNNNNLNLVLLSIPSDFGRFLSMGNYDEYYKYLKEATGMEDASLNEYEKFEKWLKQKSSSKEIDKILNRYKDIEEFCLKIKVLEKGLFNTLDVTTIKRARKMVLQSKIFKIKYKKFYDDSVRAIEFYYEYVSGLLQAENTKTVNDMMLKVDGGNIFSESEYRLWLLSTGIAEETCRGYISVLHTAEKYAHDYQIGEKIFSNATFEQVKESINKLLADEKFISLNRIQHNRFSGSFSKLKNFIDYKVKGGITSNIERRVLEHKEQKNDQEIAILNCELEALLLKSKDGISKEEILNHFDKYSTRYVNASLESCHAVLVLKKYYHKNNIFCKKIC